METQLLGNTPAWPPAALETPLIVGADPPAEGVSV